MVKTQQWNTGDDLAGTKLNQVLGRTLLSKLMDVKENPFQCLER